MSSYATTTAVLVYLSCLFICLFLCLSDCLILLVSGLLDYLWIYIYIERTDFVYEYVRLHTCEEEECDAGENNMYLGKEKRKTQGAGGVGQRSQEQNQESSRSSTAVN